MANGITGGLTDLLGIDTNAGDAQLQQALAALQAVGVPTADMLKLPELEKYVSAGVLTPQQYQAILADPEAYSNAIAANQDNTGRDAQTAALQQLGSIVNSGGSSAINDANLKNNLNQTNQAMQAARSGIEDNAKQRGVYGGGLEFISKLLNEQGNAQNANLSATNAAADNAKLALQALTQQGQLGGQLQGQANQSAQAQAEAARQIAEYNSQLQSAANQYNAQTANAAQAGNLANAQDIANRNTEGAQYRTKYNAQIPQTLFQDQMQKATGIAGSYGDQAKLNQQQEQMGAGLTGGLLGSGATLYGDYLKGKTPPKDQGYAHGGEVGDDKTWLERIAERMASNDPALTADVRDARIASNVENSTSTAKNYAQGGTVPHYQPPQAPQGGGHKGIPKEALMALAGVMAAYPILRYGFGGGQPQQTSLQDDMGSAPMQPEDPMNMCHGGTCYARGGEVHDHNLCMEAGGPVPGDQSDMPPMADDESQDVIDAHLSPGEVVLPRSVSQAPDAPQKAAAFMGHINGQGPSSFADVLAKLEENGLELRLSAKGM